MYLLSSKDKIYTTESSKRDLKWSLRRRPKWAKGQRTKVSTKIYLQTLLALGLCWVLFWSHMKTSTEKSPLDGKKALWAAHTEVNFVSPHKTRVSARLVSEKYEQINSGISNY